jgi:polysaccharide biosynthesis transport protein
MTTLPQTTARLARPPSALPQVVSSNGAAAPFGFMAHSPASGPQMTASDAWRVLRANAWLIAALLIFSIIAGFVINLWLARYYPKFTASAIVAVSPPIQLDPLKYGQAPMDPTILGMEQQNNAQLLKNLQLYSEVLLNENSPVRQTAWFNQFSSAALAEQNLEDYLIVAPSQDTNQIRVEFSTTDPQDAIKIIETVVNQLIDDEGKQNAQDQQRRSARLTNMLQGYQSRHTDIADDMHDKEVRLNISGVAGSGRLNVKETALADLTKDKMDQELRNSMAQEEFNHLDAMIRAGNDPPQVLQQVNSDPEVQRFRQLVQDRDLQILRMRGNYGAGNEQMKELQDEKDLFGKKEAQEESDTRATARVSVLDQARREMESSKIALERVNQEIASLDADIESLNKDLGDYQADKDALEKVDSQISDINAQLDQITQFTNSKDQTNLEWKSHPAASEIPTFPKLSVTMTLSIALGLLISLGIAFARETMDTTVRSPRDITRVGNLPMLGMVPHEDDDPQANGARLPLVIFEAPQSNIAEQLRQVRTRLQHAASLDTTRTIMITSPSPGDGKSTIAANLASGLALNGRRILLVDANFRRPAVHRIFNVSNEVGFSDVLNKLDLFHSAAQATQVPNLTIMCSGAKPTNATELMESQLLADFIERAVEEYDHVIFDAGPLLLASETAALAPRVDGVVTVVRAQMNTRGLLQRLRDSLRQVKAEHLGVVLNAVRSQGGGYYRSHIRTYYDYQNGHSAA